MVEACGHQLGKRIGTTRHLHDDEPLDAGIHGLCLALQKAAERVLPYQAILQGGQLAHHSALLIQLLLCTLIVLVLAQQ